MIRRVVWLAPAHADLLDIDWRIAADVAAAVRVFALTGQGDVRFTKPGMADEYRLYVPPHRYYARIRYSDDVVYVERVFGIALRAARSLTVAHHNVRFIGPRPFAAGGGPWNALLKAVSRASPLVASSAPRR